MKKFSLILLLLLALSLTLTACTQNAATTETVARWEDGERHVFNISKVDWEASSVTVDGTEFVKNPRWKLPCKTETRNACTQLNKCFTRNTKRKRCKTLPFGRNLPNLW